MKKQSAKTSKSEKQTEGSLQEKRKELAMLKFRVAANEEKNVSQVKKLKKEIARMLTKISMNVSAA